MSRIRYPNRSSSINITLRHIAETEHFAVELIVKIFPCPSVKRVCGFYVQGQPPNALMSFLSLLSLECSFLPSFFLSFFLSRLWRNTVPESASRKYDQTRGGGLRRGGYMKEKRSIPISLDSSSSFSIQFNSVRKSPLAHGLSKKKPH